MVCRHSPGDPACGAGERQAAAYEASSLRKENESLRRKLEQGKIDARSYEILEVEEVSGNLVIKAKYPSCKDCSYEGVKVLVYKGLKAIDALKWRTIDPHFANPGEKRSPAMAPSPAARFPASGEGWDDAIAYARTK